MKKSILSRSKNILKVLFYLDLILLVISIFYRNPLFATTSLILNILFIGSYIILQKYYMLFDAMILSSNFSKSLNGALNKIDG